MVPVVHPSESPLMVMINGSIGSECVYNDAKWYVCMMIVKMIVMMNKICPIIT